MPLLLLLLLLLPSSTMEQDGNGIDGITVVLCVYVLVGHADGYHGDFCD